MSAIESVSWNSQLKFVDRLSGVLTMVLEWGGGCSCHEEDYAAGRPVECNMKGRRLGEAFPFACANLRSLLESANRWTSADFGSDELLFHQCVACVRALHRYAMLKIGFLDVIPWLLARLDQPGVAARALEQYQSAPRISHHRVSHEFLDEAGDLREHVLAITPSGENVSVKLALEIKSLRDIPFNDTINEGPHSICHKAMLHSRAAKFPWVFSSCRLPQNLSDADTVFLAVDACLQTEWVRYKSILKTSEQAAMKGSAMTRKAFENCLYRLDHCVAHNGDRGGDPDADGDDGDDPDDGVILRDAHRADIAGAMDLPDVPPREEFAARMGRSSDFARLHREYLGACLQLGMHITIGAPGEAPEDSFEFAVFQILGVETKMSLVPTYLDIGRVPNIFKVTVQKLEYWQSFLPAGIADATLDVFAIGEPFDIDLLRSCGQKDPRMIIRSWTVCPSDVSDCVGLRDGVHLVPVMQLRDSNVPVLCLVDSLLLHGFVGVDAVVIHEDSSARTYDQRKLPSKRCYLQCVLSLGDLLAAGITSFTSEAPQAFYALMLRKPSAAVAGLTAKAYKQRLAVLDGDPLALAALEDAVVAPTVSVYDGVVGVGGPGTALPDDAPLLALLDASLHVVAAPPTPIEGDDGVPSTPPPVGDAADAAGGSEGDDGAIEGDAAADLPERIRGQKVKVERHWNVDGSLKGAGMRVQCLNPDHKHSRFRSLHLDVAVFGPRAAEFYLGAWLGQSFTSDRADHGRLGPSRAAIREYADTYG